MFTLTKGGSRPSDTPRGTDFSLCAFVPRHLPCHRPTPPFHAFSSPLFNLTNTKSHQNAQNIPLRMMTLSSAGRATPFLSQPSANVRMLRPTTLQNFPVAPRANHLPPSLPHFFIASFPRACLPTQERDPFFSITYTLFSIHYFPDLFCFVAIAHSLRKTPGGGAQVTSQIPNPSITPRESISSPKTAAKPSRIYLFRNESMHHDVSLGRQRRNNSAKPVVVNKVFAGIDVLKPLQLQARFFHAIDGTHPSHLPIRQLLEDVYFAFHHRLLPGLGPAASVARYISATTSSVRADRMPIPQITYSQQKAGSTEVVLEFSVATPRAVFTRSRRFFVVQYWSLQETLQSRREGRPHTTNWRPRIRSGCQPGANLRPRQEALFDPERMASTRAFTCTACSSSSKVNPCTSSCAAAGNFAARNFQVCSDARSNSRAS